MAPLPSGVTPYPFDLSLGLAEFEAAIATEPVEVAAAFDARGRFVLRPRTGAYNRVDFGALEARFLPGTTVTHNHPDGTTLSGADVALAAEHDLAEMRAVTPAGVVYTILRPASAWPSPDEMNRAALGFVRVFRAENESRKARGRSIMNTREQAAFTFERQRDAFERLGVEMRRTSVWR